VLLVYQAQLRRRLYLQAQVQLGRKHYLQVAVVISTDPIGGDPVECESTSFAADSELSAPAPQPLAAGAPCHSIAQRVERECALVRDARSHGCSPRQPARRRHVRTDKRYDSVAQTLGRRGRSQAVAHADGAEDVGKHRHWQISEAGGSRHYGRRIVVSRHRFGFF